MKKIIILIVIVFAFSNTYAEQKIITGKILLNKDFALGNIIVSAKKSKATVSSNMLGEFSIACEKNDILIFEASPFKTVRKSVKGKDFIKVKMEFKDATMDQSKIADLGYLNIEKVESVIKSAKSSDDNFLAYTNIYDLIKRKFPHLKVNGTEIVMRGIRSVTTSSAALLVVDGSTVADFKHIQTTEVKEISLLVGSDAAMYGSRGANGVVAIKTK